MVKGKREAREGEELEEVWEEGSAWLWAPQANVCYFICLERAYLFSDVWPPGRLL